jgi:hypothetical protein
VLQGANALLTCGALTIGHGLPADHSATVISPCSAPIGDHGGAAMIVGHMLATVATAWLLARGEAALWRLVNRAIAAATVTVVMPGGAFAALPVAPVAALSGAPRHETAPRGPPMGRDADG